MAPIYFGRKKYWVVWQLATGKICLCWLQAVVIGFHRKISSYTKASYQIKCSAAHIQQTFHFFFKYSI